MVGNRRTAGTIGLDFIAITESVEKVRYFSGPGLYYEHRNKIVQGDGTGSHPSHFYYSAGDTSLVWPTFEMGIQYPPFKGAVFGISFHLLRGPSVNLGVNF